MSFDVEELAERLLWLAHKDGRWHCLHSKCKWSTRYSMNALKHTYEPNKKHGDIETRASKVIPEIFETTRWCRYCALPFLRYGKKVKEHDPMHRKSESRENIRPQCTGCEVAWPSRQNAHSRSCPPCNTDSECRWFRIWNEETLRYDYISEILEDLVCPSVEVLPEPPVSNEVHQKRLGNDGESRVKRARQLLGLDKSLSTEIDELRPVDHTLSASLAKSAQLLSSRHLRIYFPASARY